MICNRLELCVSDCEVNDSIAVCCNKINKCIQSNDNRSKVKCEENKMVYQYENEDREKILCLRMDGGIIVEDATVPSGTKKCDYVIYVYNDKIVILVELKGTDIATALEQIDNSLTLFESFYKKSKNVYARIVPACSQPMLLSNPKYVKVHNKLKKLNGNILIKERFLSEAKNDLNAYD